MCVIESSGMAGKVFRKEKNKPVGNKFDKLDLFNNYRYRRDHNKVSNYVCDQNSEISI